MNELTLTIIVAVASFVVLIATVVYWKKCKPPDLGVVKNP